MDAIVEQVRKQEQKPKLESASLRKRIKNVFLLLSFLGLISANIATLVSDSLHTAAFNTLKSFLGYALTDTALTKILGQSPTVKKNDDVAVKTKELVDKNTRLARNNTELVEKHAKLKKESDRKIKTAQKVSKRIATRSVMSARRHIVSLPGEAIPVLGTSIIVGVTVWDIHDLCQNMKDINQLNSAFGHALEDQDQICGIEVPTTEQVLAEVKENWQEAYDNAKVQIELSVRIPSVVYSIQENTVNEHTQTYSFNIIGSSGNLAAISNPVVEGSSAGRTLPRQPSNDL
ncbi:hypothetical protein [Nitrosomonas oligotropha]|uniref:Uncharacterized protein n=1 Tax=Nitrosomonas oligotropha TaxID=42354 RepID=A0A1H8TM94_9PROT|nr:hypothetical protein [Nitrosomonas oligotropha]SDX32906.1 hypothetical protein SAMN05216300_1292 [Nitrosomonas oligotropha]SEO91936.1 hypothetical protein SAMN05216333_1262 [Nitrosomonas oligotropha]